MRCWRPSEGQDRAFAKLDEIKDNVIWWSEGAQPPQMLADEEAVIATAYNGRIFNAQVNEDQPFKIMWDHQMFEADGWVVPVGNEDKLDLIKDYMYSPRTRSVWPTRRNTSPIRRRASPRCRGSATHADSGVDMKPRLPTAP